MIYKPYHPPHIYSDNYPYFITSRTKNKRRFFDNDQRKNLLREVLASAIKLYDIKIYAWVILSNHYHLLLRIMGKKQIFEFIKSFHGKNAIELNKLDGIRGRSIWANYWDHSIRDENDFYKHFNYIHHNPVKHGYVVDTKDYEFSSYNFWLKKRGKKWLDSRFEMYPIIDFTPRDKKPLSNKKQFAKL